MPCLRTAVVVLVAVVTMVLTVPLPATAGFQETITKGDGFPADPVELGGVLEIRVPHAERSDGFGGRTKSEVKVEMVLLGGDGSVLMHAVGMGRPLNVVSSPERVAGTVIENILRKAWK